MLETYIIGASDGLVDTFPLFGDCFSSLIAFLLSIRSGSAGTSGVAPNDGSIHGDAIKQTSPLEALLLLPLSLHFPPLQKATPHYRNRAIDNNNQHSNMSLHRY
jgi:hypothetical protein